LNGLPFYRIIVPKDEISYQKCIWKNTSRVIHQIASLYHYIIQYFTYVEKLLKPYRLEWE
ncbi:hypothetical protein K1T71_014951, partial [Dendrolimus kikuchii]